MPDAPKPTVSHYSDPPNKVDIRIKDDGNSLVLEVIDWSSGIPGAAKIVVPRASAMASLDAVINELYVNSDVYAAMLRGHLTGEAPAAHEPETQDG